MTKLCNLLVYVAALFGCALTHLAELHFNRLCAPPNPQHSRVLCGPSPCSAMVTVLTLSGPAVYSSKSIFGHLNWQLPCHACHAMLSRTADLRLDCLQQTALKYTHERPHAFCFQHTFHGSSSVPLQTRKTCAMASSQAGSPCDCHCESFCR